MSQIRLPSCVHNVLLIYEHTALLSFEDAMLPPLRVPSAHDILTIYQPVT